MARITGGGSVPMDLPGADFAAALGFPTVVLLPDSIAFQQGGTRYVFAGSDFTSTPSGIFGAVTQIRIEEAGQVALVLDGFSVGFNQLRDWAAAGGNAEVQFRMLSNADVITGTGYGDRLGGFLNDDTLMGENGNDTLDGSGGNDSLVGGAHADSMAGGTGDDRYVVDWGGDQVLELPGGGTDHVTSFITFILPAEVENLTLAGSALGGGGNALGNAIIGNDGANLLDGQDGNDLLLGGDGADTLLGRTGQDGLRGGAGNDALDGGEGNDLLSGDAGDDTIFGRGGQDTLDGGDGDDLLYGDSNGTAAGGNDVVRGGAGRDRIIAGDGSDLILGGDGDDFLVGSALGGDVMIGGAGADSYLLGDAQALLVVQDVADVLGGGPDAVVQLKTSFGSNDGFDLRGMLRGLGAPAVTMADLRSLGWLRLVQQGDEALLQLDGNGGGDGFATIIRLINTNAADVGDYMFLV